MRTTTEYREIWTLLEQRQPREALERVDPLLAAEDDVTGHTGLRVLRAWALFQMALLVPAEAELRTVVEADPTDVWARFTLGRTLERQSRYGDALGHLRLAHAMSGDTEHEVAVLRVQRRLAETTAD